MQGLLVSALLLSPSLLIIFIAPPLPSHSILHQPGRTIIPAGLGHNSLFKGSKEKVKCPCYKKKKTKRSTQLFCQGNKSDQYGITTLSVQGCAHLEDDQQLSDWT